MRFFDPWSHFLERRRTPKIKAIPHERIYVYGAPYVVQSVTRDMEGRVSIELLLAIKHRQIHTVNLDDWKEDDEATPGRPASTDPE